LGELNQLKLDFIPPISAVGSRDRTPFIISRSSTPNTATSPPMELSYSQPIFLDESGFAASGTLETTNLFIKCNFTKFMHIKFLLALNFYNY